MKPNYQEHVELTFVEVENLMESTTPPLSAQKWYYTSLKHHILYIYICIYMYKTIKPFINKCWCQPTYKYPGVNL